MQYSELRNILNEYTWDDNFVVAHELLSDNACDLAMALEIFYLADGYAYLKEPDAAINVEMWGIFIKNLYEDIISAKYLKTESHFKVPLTKVQKYQLIKKQIPEVILTDL